MGDLERMDLSKPKSTGIPAQELMDAARERLRTDTGSVAPGERFVLMDERMFTQLIERALEAESFEVDFGSPHFEPVTFFVPTVRFNVGV